MLKSLFSVSPTSFKFVAFISKFSTVLNFNVETLVFTFNVPKIFWEIFILLFEELIVTLFKLFFVFEILTSPFLALTSIFEIFNL